jgi:hypothetical protein
MPSVSNPWPAVAGWSDVHTCLGGDLVPRQPTARCSVSRAAYRAGDQAAHDQIGDASENGRLGAPVAALVVSPAAHPHRLSLSAFRDEPEYDSTRALVTCLVPNRGDERDSRPLQLEDSQPISLHGRRCPEAGRLRGGRAALSEPPKPSAREMELLT